MTRHWQYSGTHAHEFVSIKYYALGKACKTRSMQRQSINVAILCVRETHKTDDALYIVDVLSVLKTRDAGKKQA